MRLINKLNRLLVFVKTFIGYLGYKVSKKKNLQRIGVISSPRGGSTWLGEMLSEGKKSIFIDEPLFVNSHKRLKTVGITWDPHLENNQSKIHLYFFKDLFSLRFFHWRPLVKNKISKFLFTDKLVFKFINANLLLEYFVSNFKDEKFIYLIRNPYALVSSQLNHKGWLWVQNETSMKIPEHLSHLDCFEDMKEVKLHNLQPEQVLIFHWCLTNKPVISSVNNNKKWLTVTYENLLEDNSSDLQRIREYINEKKKLNTDIISSSTKNNAAEEIKLGKQLNKWKSKLTTDQIVGMQEILRLFDFEVYDIDSGLPKLNTIYNK
jgi:hypothetical protein